LRLGPGRLQVLLRSLASVPASSAAGACLRVPLRLVPRSAAVPIFTGPLRGCRWTAGAGNQSCLLGTFGMPKQGLFDRLVQPGDTVLDIGAHAGFYSLLFSRLVGPDGRVFAFEPLPANLRHLREHLRLNAIPNVSVCPVAVGEAPGTSSFAPGPNSYTGALSPTGPLTVAVASLDDMHAAGLLPEPDLIKIDVEGGEERVLLGARRLIRMAQPSLVVATHGEHADQGCREVLRTLGYSVSPLQYDPDEGPELMARPIGPVRSGVDGPRVAD
jgi:FkbM family methyltransferase